MHVSVRAHTYTLRNQMEREDVYWFGSLWLQGLPFCVVMFAVRASTGGDGELERTGWTQLNWVSLRRDIERAVHNTLSYIYLCAFFGDSTDLLENSFFVNIAKMQPYILHEWVLYPIYFLCPGVILCIKWWGIEAGLEKNTKRPQTWTTWDHTRGTVKILQNSEESQVNKKIHNFHKIFSFALRYASGANFYF